MKVLLIEDDIKIRGHVARRGLRNEGFCVETAADGLDGLWRASEFHFGRHRPRYSPTRAERISGAVNACGPAAIGPR